MEIGVWSPLVMVSSFVGDSGENRLQRSARYEQKLRDDLERQAKQEEAARRPRAGQSRPEFKCFLDGASHGFGGTVHVPKRPGSSSDRCKTDSMVIEDGFQVFCMKSL